MTTDTTTTTDTTPETPASEPESEPVKINITSWNCNSSGLNAYILIDPEDRDVTTWCNVGSGMPMSTYHDRTILIGLPIMAYEADVQTWCEDHADDIAAICDAYEGSGWDGHNHVGRWSDEADDLRTALRQALDEATGGCSCDTIRSYWPADDWLSGDWQGVMGRLLRVGLTQATEEESATSDAVLDEDDVRDALRERAEWQIGQLDSDDIDDAVKIEAYQAALADRPAPIVRYVASGHGEDADWGRINSDDTVSWYGSETRTPYCPQADDLVTTDRAEVERVALER